MWVGHRSGDAPTRLVTRPRDFEWDVWMIVVSAAASTASTTSTQHRAAVLIFILLPSSRGPVVRRLVLVLVLLSVERGGATMLVLLRCECDFFERCDTAHWGLLVWRVEKWNRGPMGIAL